MKKVQYKKKKEKKWCDPGQSDKRVFNFIINQKIYNEPCYTQTMCNIFSKLKIKLLSYLHLAERNSWARSRSWLCSRLKSRRCFEGSRKTLDLCSFLCLTKEKTNKIFFVFVCVVDWRLSCWSEKRLLAEREREKVQKKNKKAKKKQDNNWIRDEDKAKAPRCCVVFILVSNRFFRRFVEVCKKSKYVNLFIDEKNNCAHKIERIYS